ncbi:uncharacterized protein (DUF2147 family) [Sphingomonas naasensis]|uniref:DUF2147 domain-containing protein n=1 Tax=Sphingomonas naasensis TaxID=1344951 RepID=A0A4S1WER4_9SPHN|nr:DUF2147 domain-containing protein [Sphingomonas naasensis]NIJ21525.1 uncharacterized protein (DUF2147 family) [Sphingomonas naasensis]TGX41524.1 DUF2147 domain-containing protein [Sphingomonas naasensis]
MRKTRIVTAGMALLAAPAIASARPARSPEGMWLNPHGSVAVRAGACGDRICGWVVWASAAAQKDARESGVDKLIGTELLEDYRPYGQARWSGTVFVPDMGRHFASEIEALSPDRLKVKGCILGGLICKSQVWTRIAQLPR